MEVASTKAFTEDSMEVVEDAAKVTSTKASRKLPRNRLRKLPRKTPRKLPRELSRKLPRKLPQIRKLPPKHFYRCLGFSPMKASGSFQGRSEAQRLPRKLPRKLFVKAFEVASTKIRSYIHVILLFTSMEASAASTESRRLPRQLPRIYLFCTVPPVESLPHFRQHG